MSSVNKHMGADQVYVKQKQKIVFIKQRGLELKAF